MAEVIDCVAALVKGGLVTPGINALYIDIQVCGVVCWFWCMYAFMLRVCHGV
jgi:hypothetical protein